MSPLLAPFSVPLVVMISVQLNHPFVFGGTPRLPFTTSARCGAGVFGSVGVDLDGWQLDAHLRTFLIASRFFFLPLAQWPLQQFGPVRARYLPFLYTARVTYLRFSLHRTGITWPPAVLAMAL